MPLNLQVHETRRIPGTTQVRQVRAVPYIRFAQRGEPPIYAQAGQFFAEEQLDPIDPEDVPEWVKERLTLLTPQGRAKIGMASEEDRKAVAKARRVRRGRNLAISTDEDEEGDED